MTSPHVAAFKKGTKLDPVPFIPLLGRVVPRLAQVSDEQFAEDPQIQARALAEVATAVEADVVTIGLHTDPSIGSEVVRRIQPLLHGRGAAACLHVLAADVVRAYCEAGAEMLLLMEPDLSEPAPFRTVANVAGFYDVPVLLVAAADDPAGVAQNLGLQGAFVDSPDGSEPGIVGGGLTVGNEVGPVASPRQDRFFWTFPGEVPADAPPESLVALGRHLHR